MLNLFGGRWEFHDTTAVRFEQNRRRKVAGLASAGHGPRDLGGFDYGVYLELGKLAVGRNGRRPHCGEARAIAQPRLNGRGGPGTVERIKIERIGGIVPACGSGRCRRGSRTTQRERARARAREKQQQQQQQQQQQKGVFAAEKGEVAIKLDPYS